ncbi:MAG: T9SS type A sorting domain-containing protein [Candidatus Marinimicrobia bacterium]|nr:T9SS type A sorting domain-containing protein [Candidatus Neomarinimicrobiota bacterium]MCF7828260.1 T9SS type A sorting domain-containing protein [Candidatus Neomarinimicrobiota bacterium]MCF7879565.1 T9SS type A sorting domain-containing protein [Candidatus Neomarinimicrobiota bacterium]
MKQLLTFVIGLALLFTPLPSLANQLTLINHGLCGFPQTSKPVSSPVFVRPLEKPSLAADTTFNIRKNVAEQSNEFIEDVDFTKVFTSADLDIFVETSEWESSRVISQTIEDLRGAMLEETPSGSVFPEMGIYEGEIELFGQPPDIDGNGKIVILLIDVRDNYKPGEGGNFIAGYFDPADQTNQSGNRSDILYIDTNPGLQSGNFLNTMMTAAHEMQHLIHFAYDRDEELWVNEGLSEVTAHLFGLPGRNFSHFLGSPSRNLTTFDQSIEDYTKVGLWTLYLYTQYGTNVLRQITHNPGNGTDALESVFSANGIPGFKRVFTNWSVANVGHAYLEPAVAGDTYKYGGFTIGPPEPAMTVSNFPTPAQRGTIKGYSASYIRIIGGSDVSAQVLPPTSIPLDVTSMLSDGSQSNLEQAFNVNSSTTQQLNNYNDYGNAWLVLTNPSPADNSSFSVTFNGSGGQIVETLDYAGGPPNFYITLQGGTAATDFSFPSPETEIIQASVNLHNTLPVTLELRDEKQGSLLASNRLDSPSRGWNTWQLDSLNIKTDKASLIVVPDQDADSNGVGYSDTLGFSGNSYYRPQNSNSFFALGDLRVGSGENETELDGDWNMRMQISYPGTGSYPTGDSLTHNPWILSHNIHGETVLLDVKSGRQGGPIRIDVFNILGQHIKTIANTEHPPNYLGTYAWDAANSNGTPVTSGMYFMLVQFNGEKKVRKITLLK